MNTVNLEVWKDIKGYEGLYQVSNSGMVKSFIKKEPHILKGSFTTTGYKKIELSKNKHKKSHKIHRLVAFAFINNPHNKPNINHKDGNPLNNNVRNIEWCTQKENVAHALKTGLKKCYKFDRNELIKHYENNGLRGVAQIFNVSYVTISKVLKKYNIPIRKQGTETKYILTKEFILKELEYKTQTIVASEIGCDPSLISKYLKNIKEKGVVYNK